MAKTLDKFFDPRSIAVVGATGDKTKVGYALISNILASKNRSVYPINISEKVVLGVPAFTSIKEIPGEVDLAVIAVRADIVPQILAECGEKKIPAAIVISAGFKEAGEKGIELEQKIAEVAKANNIALLGPNCLGTIDSHANLNASFAPAKPLRGDIAFLSQSGALGTSILDLATKEGVGFSKFISLGNEAQLTEIEFLEYLANDDCTKAILLYLEKLSNGPEFMRLAAEITKKKPIVVLKAGRSARGAKAVASHTGALASDDAVFSAACKQTGIIAVESIREFFNLAKLFQLGIRTPLQKLVILTNGGGPSVVTADLVDLSKSLSLVEFSDETKDALRKVLPPMAAVGNPVDIIGDALSNRYNDALKIITAEKDVDGILLMLTPQMMTEVEATAKLVTEYRKVKPIIPIFIGGPMIETGLSYFKQNGLPDFNFPKDAVEALDDLAMGVKKMGTISNSPDGAHLGMLSFADTKKLLDEAGIPLAGAFAKEKSDLGSITAQFGAVPLAMKAISPDIIHKTDSGAVALNINSLIDAEKAWDDMHNKNPNAKIEGVLIQPMVKGKEVIIGMKRDPVFGATILFGLGGIYTNVLKDTSLRIIPITKELALEMIGEIKASRILLNPRDSKPLDINSLADLIIKISSLSIAHPELKEIDLNPVMVTPDATHVVDVRIMI